MLQPGGDCDACEIPSLGVTQETGFFLRKGQPELEVVWDDHVLGCDDDGRTVGDNAGLSQLSGCVPAGDYIVSVRGFDDATGPYVLTIEGAAGCTPTDPPTISDTGTGSSDFCPPNEFTTGCD